MHTQICKFEVTICDIKVFRMGRNYTRQSNMISCTEEAGCSLDLFDSGVERPSFRNRSEGPSASGRSEAER